MTSLRTVLIVALLNATVHAQPAITASDAWITESAADGTASAYLSVSNPTMYDIYLESATTDAAGKVELREGEKAVKVITVAAYGSIELKPGGAYLRLSDVKKPLKSGDTVELTLTTDGGIVLTVSAPVKRP